MKNENSTNDVQQIAEQGEDTSVPIRAISRGLAVLKTINRLGSVNLTEVSRETQIPYPTVCRIVNTLLHEKMIEREPNRRRYRPTFLVKSLAVGYQRENQLVTIANKHIMELCDRLSWPISIATCVGSSMVLRDSTHHMTSMTFSHYYPGYTLPVTQCSTGKVYLAYCDFETRNSILESAARDVKQTSAANTLEACESYWTKIREKGFAVQIENRYTADPGKTSSIAVPIMVSGKILAAMALVFFKSTLTPKKAEEEFFEALKNTSEKISAELMMTK